MYSKPIVTICTPSRESVLATFTYDLTRLLKTSPEAEFIIALGTYLQNLRTSLVNQSIKMGASHVLFIDSDMRFPHDTLKRLLAHDLDIVGANCKQRTQDAWTARRGDKFVSSTEKSGLEEVDSLGFGVTLIKTDVFVKMKEPWFAMPFDGEKYIGEDIYFSHHVKESEYKIFIDHDLSQEIKHTGLKEY